MTWPEVFNYGVPTGILFMAAFGLYRLILWAKEAIVGPITKSHIDLIEALREHLPKQQEAVNKMLENQAIVIELLKKKGES